MAAVDMENHESSMQITNQFEFLDMLDEALNIPYKNPKFALFIFITSIPLLCFMIFFEIILESTLFDTFKTLYQPSYNFNDYYYIIWDFWPHSVTRDLFPRFVQLSVLYLVPYHLLEYFNTIVMVQTASKLYAEEKEVTLKEMMHMPILKTRLKGPFITSICAHLLSTSTLFGMIWLVMNYLILSPGLDNRVLITLLHGVPLVALVVKYLDWSATWNMGVVISILEFEEKIGVEALELSAYYSKGSTRRGQLLMLVFFVWGIGLRLSCFYAVNNFGGASKILVTTFLISLVCLGNVMKWVASVIYYYDCKERILEKKFDKEVASDTKTVDV